jgi:hypothetical protein
VRSSLFDQRSGPAPSYYVRWAFFTPSTDSGTVTAACDDGDHAIAGGYEFGHDFDLHPTPPPSQTPLVLRDTPFVFVHQTGGLPSVVGGWTVSLSFAQGTERVYAVCLSDQSATFPPFPGQ